MVGISAFAVAAFFLPMTSVWMPWALLNFALWASGSWFGLPAQQALVSEMASGATGTVMAFNSSALFLGGAVGPALIGWLIDRGGFELAGPVASALGFFAVGMAWLFLREEPAATAQTAEAPA